VSGGVLPHEVVAALARKLRAGAPTVFVLEDAHWADEATLDVLRLLTRRVAGAMGVTPLADADLGELQPYGFQSSTPLWYYVLKEAELVEDGLHLGSVGGRIVAEVLLGLLQSDTGSYLVRKPRWTPTLSSAGSSFRMKDFLTFAGVDPSSRGQ